MAKQNRSWIEINYEKRPDGLEGAFVYETGTGIYQDSLPKLSFTIQGPVGDPPIYVISRSKKVEDYRSNKAKALTRAYELALEYSKGRISNSPRIEKAIRGNFEKSVVKMEQAKRMKALDEIVDGQNTED